MPARAPSPAASASGSPSGPAAPRAARDAPPAAPRWKVVLAFAAVYFIWGSTYLAIRWVIETLPPFSSAGVRFLLAGGLLYAWSRLRGAGAPSLRHWRSAAVVGTLMLVVGNGLVVWAQQIVPSGLTALLIASTPLWIVLLDGLRPGGRAPGGRVVLGLAGGFAGVLLLIGPGRLGGGAAVAPAGALALILASLGWATGSLYSRHAPLPESPLLATGMQMLVAGCLQLALGLLLGEAGRLDLAGVSLRSLLALAYLVFFGSIVAFTAYIWLLRVTTPARATTYAYVNPVVAVLLGWGLAGEPVTLRTLLAMVVIVSSVVLITTGRR